MAAIIVTNDESHERRGGGGGRDLKEHQVQIPRFTREEAATCRDEGATSGRLAAAGRCGGAGRRCAAEDSAPARPPALPFTSDMSLSRGLSLLKISPLSRRGQ